MRRKSRACLAVAAFLGAGLAVGGWGRALAAEGDARDAGPGAAEPASPAPWYGAGVRPTEPRSPEQERAGFHLPDGFEIELVASEPAIAKPMNLAFDTRGRLWVSQSVEYPYPAPKDRAGRDAIRVLEDRDQDGHYETAATFVDGLNIPIGLLPYGDGVIAFSIPNLWYFRDTDGDGRCDRREILYGPFDTTRDAHGMVNSLRWGEDGWIYACHGFSNHSRVAGRDGHEVELVSGNTFRFRPDGSRIERFTQGQVNPFGMTRGPLGDLFSADCHSKPISQLLRGACYPSFGRPHDGLGFLPPAMEHLHGSTAIAGLELTSGPTFPAGYRGQFVSGNVMTSRINRNALVRRGATIGARELPDFLTSDDPWFRPVDIRLGPDGALYVADFYNRIIGHYEVPLEHPGRDRHRGRIWRITPPEADEHSASALRILLSDDDQTLMRALDHGNDALRRLAMRRLISSPSEVIESALVQRWPAFSPLGRAAGLWVLERRGTLDAERLDEGLGDAGLEVRLAAIRILASRAAPLDAWRDTLHRRLSAAPAAEARAAAETLASSPQTADIVPLLERLERTGSEDPVLRQALRIAVRDVLENAADIEHSDRLVLAQLQGHRADALAAVMLGVHRPSAGRWLTHYLQNAEPGDAAVGALVTHAAQWIPEPQMDALVAVARQRAGSELAGQIDWLQWLDAGKKSRSDGAASKALSRWALELTTERVASLERRVTEGNAGQVTWTSEGGDAWPLQSRQCDDGRAADFLCSHPLGESHTGVLRSGAFNAPPEMRFWIVGHNGHPQEPDARRNRVQLVDATDGRVIREALPPRSDTAALVHWQLEDFDGRPVRLRCIDHDSAGAYAWLGIGRFEPLASESEAWQREFDEALRWTDRWQTEAMSERLAQLAQRADLVDDVARWRCLQSWARGRNDAVAERLASLLLRFHVPPQLAEEAVRQCFAGDADSVALELVETVSRGMTTTEQVAEALHWATHRATAPWVLSGVNEGWLASTALQDPDVWESLSAVLSEKELARLEPLRRSGAPASEIDFAELAARIRQHPGDAPAGRRLFEQHCATCHQIAGRGAVVGPQLDGAGARDVQRLLEDVLAPDRNVDRAFRAVTFLLSSGQVHVGLVQSETERSVEIVETDGRKITLPIDAIEIRKPTSRSLMPSGFADVLKDQGVADLVEYLTRQAGQQTADQPTP